MVLLRFDLRGAENVSKDFVNSSLSLSIGFANVTANILEASVTKGTGRLSIGSSLVAVFGRKGMTQPVGM